MKHSQIIKFYKTPTEAAKRLGVTLQTLRNWKSKFPLRSQTWVAAIIDLHKNGKL